MCDLRSSLSNYPLNVVLDFKDSILLLKLYGCFYDFVRVCAQKEKSLTILEEALERKPMNLD